MTIFGGVPEALYKVAVPPRPPRPATEKSYILGEGQQQDDIEVKHIDMRKGVVTFNNHGVVQEIPLTKAEPITTPTPVVMRPGGPPAAFAFRGFRPPGNRNAPPPANRPNQNNPGNAAGNVSGNNSGPGLGNVGGTAGSTPSGQNNQQLTPEEQMIMIAAQKAHLKETGDPTWRIYPPTPLDQDAGTVNSSSGAPPSP